MHAPKNQTANGPAQLLNIRAQVADAMKNGPDDLVISRVWPLTGTSTGERDGTRMFGNERLRPACMIPRCGIIFRP